MCMHVGLCVQIYMHVRTCLCWWREGIYGHSVYSLFILYSNPAQKKIEKRREDLQPGVLTE